MRGDSDDMLEKKLQSVDAIIHLAGSNRPLDQEEFHVDNFLFTKFITSKLIQHRRCIPIIFSSSIQVEKGGNYGDSKKLAESALKEYFEKRVVQSTFSDCPTFLESGPNLTIIQLWRHFVIT